MQIHERGVPSELRHWAQRVAFWSFTGIASVGCAATRAATSPPKPAAPITDPNRAKATQLIAALAAGDAETAERDFSARLRAELSPAVLGSTWRSILARCGAFESYRVEAKDHPLGKDRFSIELDFAQRSLLALVVFEPQSSQVIGLFFSAANAPDRTTTQPASDPQVEELTLVVGAVPSAALGAALTLPKARGAHLLPAVVLVPGSGPADRDETLQHAKPFRDIAYGLAHHGVATLRFDKRTYAHAASFDVKHSTVEEEELADAVSAVKQLAARPEIDRQRIFVVGHSLGGLIAPEIAERVGGVAGLVLLAAPGRPLPEVTLEQLRNGGAAQAELSALEAKIRHLPQLPPTETLFGVPVRYFQDLEGRNEMARAIRLHLPVLYLRGELDRNVSAVDQSNWGRALSNQLPFSEMTLPGLNHLFLPAEDDLGSDTHVPDEVSARIAAFTSQ